MIPQFELENGLVLTGISTGLDELLVSVTDEISAVGFRGRPRLIVYRGRKQTTVTTDVPIERVQGPSIPNQHWNDLVLYIDRNRTLLIQLWHGEIGRWDYMQHQSPIN